MTPEERAAQIWCLPQHSHKEMDAEFCQSIAQAIRDALAEEREANAKLVEEFRSGKREGGFREAASAIRARSTP